MKEYNNMLFSSLLLFLLISADQLSKYLIRAKGGFYICNKYLAFGFNLKYNFPLIFIVLTILVFFVNSKFKVPACHGLPPRLPSEARRPGHWRAGKPQNSISKCRIISLYCFYSPEAYPILLIEYIMVV